MSFLKKAQEAVEKRGAESTRRDEIFRQQYPAVWEWVSSDSYPDGQARETSTLLFFYEAGQWKGCLNDRDQGRGLWASGMALQDVLKALDGHLQAGTGEWRQSGPRGQARGKKR